MKRLPERFIDEDVQEVAIKNLEFLLTLALSVDDEMVAVAENVLEAFKKTKEFELAGVVGALKYPQRPGCAAHPWLPAGLCEKSWAEDKLRSVKGLNGLLGYPQVCSNSIGQIQITLNT